MILLKNADYIDFDTRTFTNGDLFVEKGQPLRFAGQADFPVVPKDAIILDCRGKLVFKSFVNAHHHAYSALARGMPMPLSPPQNFKETLEKIWWKLDKALDADTIRISALVTAMAAAKAGCTFIIDHHASPFAVKGSLSAIAEAFEQVGIGHLLCYEISDRDGMAIAEAGLQETDDYLATHQGLVGLHASFTLSDETLKQAAGLCRKHHSGIHIHTAEDFHDQAFTMEHLRLRVVERLEKHGLLASSKSILAHCLHLDETEREIIRESGVSVVQNCESNLNNRVGYFNAAGLGEKIMLGTDGMHSDMLRSLQAAYFTGLNHEIMSPELAFRRLNQGHLYLNGNGFTGDGPDNLVVLDYDSPTPVSPENLYGHLLYGMTTCNIRHVISQGELILRDGLLMKVNEAEILNEAQLLAENLWKVKDINS